MRTKKISASVQPTQKQDECDSFDSTNTEPVLPECCRTAVIVDIKAKTITSFPELNAKERNIFPGADHERDPIELLIYWNNGLITRVMSVYGADQLSPTAIEALYHKAHHYKATLIKRGGWR